MKNSSHQFHSPLRVASQLAKGKSLYRALFNLALSRYEVSGRVLDLGAKDKRGSYWEFLGKSGEVDVVHTDLAEAPGVVALDVEQRFPLPSASFDAVLAFNLFEHVRNHSLAASEVFRILRPGGTFLIATPFLHEYHADPDDFFRFTDSYLKHWWEASGFRCVSMHALGEGVFTWLGCKLPSLFFPAAHRPLATALFYLAATGLDRLAVYRPRVSARTLPERFACGYFGVFQRPASFHESVSSRDHRALQCCE